MFRVTRAEEQAVRLTMRLATEGCQKTLGELAVEENLPEPTVAKLLGMLRRGGVVQAVRGRHGGYVLAGAPETISAGAVIRSVCGDEVFEFPCHDANEPPDCSRSERLRSAPGLASPGREGVRGPGTDQHRRPAAARGDRIAQPAGAVAADGRMNPCSTSGAARTAASP